MNNSLAEVHRSLFRSGRRRTYRLSNLGNGWGYEMTPAELAKKDEFYSIYWSEYNLVKESGSSELREMPDYLNQDRPSFEARA